MNTRKTRQVLVLATSGSALKKIVLLTLLFVGAIASASAQVVFSNDFETNTAGFTAGGTIAALSRVTLPKDSAGPLSTSTSTWLGKVGFDVGKNSSTPEIAQLNLSGLVGGTSYQVNFDLLLGGSWDGAAVSYGSDLWKLTANGTTLVDTAFANGAQGINYGAYSPQRYTDQNYTNPNGPDVARFTGADQFFSRNQNGNYADDYSIYYFGHGTGNPILSFVATGSTAVLEFSRYSDSSDSADEYWALDNVSVVAQSGPGPTPFPDGAVPEPSTYGLVAAGLLLFLAISRRRIT